MPESDDSTRTPKQPPGKPKKPRPANHRGNPDSAPATSRTLEKYDLMWAAYQERQSANHVAKVTGVSWTTSRRAIEDGWPRYNLPPLRERWANIQREAKRSTDYDLVSRLADTLRYCNAVDRMAGRVVEHLEALDLAVIFNQEAMREAGPDKVLASLDRLTAIVEKTAKLKAWIAGKPTATKEVRHEVQVVQHVRRIQEMTEDELEAIIKEAKVVEARDEERTTRANVVAWVASELERWTPDVPLLPAGVSRETPATTTPPGE